MQAVRQAISTPIRARSRNSSYELLSLAPLASRHFLCESRDIQPRALALAVYVPSGSTVADHGGGIRGLARDLPRLWATGEARRRQRSRRATGTTTMPRVWPSRRRPSQSMASRTKTICAARIAPINEKARGMPGPSSREALPFSAIQPDRFPLSRHPWSSTRAAAKGQAHRGSRRSRCARRGAP